MGPSRPFTVRLYHFYGGRVLTSRVSLFYPLLHRSFNYLGPASLCSTFVTAQVALVAAGAAKNDTGAPLEGMMSQEGRFPRARAPLYPSGPRTSVWQVPVYGRQGPLLSVCPPFEAMYYHIVIR